MQEKNYLNNIKIVKMCNNPNWPPIEFAQDDNLNKMNGIAIDVLKEIEQKLNIKFQNVATKNWSESQKYLKEKRCDILPCAIETQSRKKYANFTQPYLSLPLAIFTTKDKPLISSLDEIIDKTWTRKKGSGLISQIQESYPKMKVFETIDNTEALKLVNDGEYYFTIATIPVASHIISKYMLSNLQISGYTDMKFDLSIAVRDDDILLLSILNKTLSDTSNQKLKDILKKWVSSPIKEPITDYIFIGQIFLIFTLIVLILLFFLLRESKLKKEILELNTFLEQRIEDEVIKNQEQQVMMLQQSRLAQIGEMLSMIAHQWRQPLNILSVNASLLELRIQRNKIDNEFFKGKLKIIIANSEHLSSTIDDFRDFFKPNKIEKEITYCEIIKNVLDIIKESIIQKNIILKEDLNCNTVFKAYSNEIKQVILNLIKNSEDILLDKEIKNRYIKIKTYKESDEFILEISDNGGGIDEKIIDKIFDPYFSTKSQKDGTGLGLYMSKIIIENHCGGKLTVSNQKDGAVFQIRLK